MNVFTVVNPKGGTGKTTAVANLAGACAATGARTLVVDVDPQASLTKYFFSPTRPPDEYPVANLVDVLRDEMSVQDAATGTKCRGVDLVASGPELLSYENELRNTATWPLLLRNALESARGVYEVVFVDTPGSLGLWTQMAIVAGTRTVIPVQSEMLAIYELQTVFDTLAKLAKAQLTSREVRLFATYFDPRVKEATEALPRLDERFGHQMLRARVPRSVNLTRSPAEEVPFTSLRPDHPVSGPFFDIVRDLTGRDRGSSHTAAAAPADEREAANG